MSIRDWFLGTQPEALKLHAESTTKHIIPKVPVLPYDTASLSNYATRSEIVYSCIEKKAQSACDPELIIQKKTKGGEWETVESHPALETLLEPNPWDDGESFMRTWIASENISGEFYAEIVRSRVGVPVEFYPLRPDCIFPQYVSRGGFDVLDYYAYRINGREIRYKPEDLLIRRRHGLGSLYSGVSPLYVALGAVDADIASTEYIRAFFNNGGTPSGIINVTGRNLSDEEMQAYQQKWVNRYGRGGKMRGGPAILDGGQVTYEPIGANLDTLNSDSLTMIDETRICMAFGVPPVIIGAYVGLKNVNQKASFKGAMEEFWMNTMSPELKTIRKFLTRKLLPLYGLGEEVMRNEIRFFWDMSNVEALQEDVDAIHDRIALGYKSGLYKLNEARAKIGLDEVEDEIGEEFYKAPAKEMPADEDEGGKPTDIAKRRSDAVYAKWQQTGRVLMSDADLDILLNDPRYLADMYPNFVTNGHAQKKTFNYDGLDLWREPTEAEKSIDLKAIADSYESGKDALTRVILDIRTDLIGQAIELIKKRDASDVFTLTLVPPKNAYKQVGRVIERAVNNGRIQISVDASNTRKGGFGFTGISIFGGERKSIIDDLIQRLVELTVSRVVNAVQTAAVDVFATLGVLGLDVDEIESRMREELDERSEKQYEGYARQAINEAVNAGRREEMAARSNEIGRYEYSAILDKNTCDTCETWDGATADDPSQLPETPNEECDGLSNCRCFIIAIFESEAV